MHARSCCSRAAHPWAVYPEDAQHPAKRVRAGTAGRKRVAIKHTEDRRHDTDARVCVGLVGLADAQLVKGRQTRRGGLCDGLGVLDDHGELLATTMCCYMDWMPVFRWTIWKSRPGILGVGAPSPCGCGCGSRCGVAVCTPAGWLCCACHQTSSCMCLVPAHCPRQQPLFPRPHLYPLARLRTPICMSTRLLLS